jgi:hypothetical protein
MWPTLESRRMREEEGVVVVAVSLESKKEGRGTGHQRHQALVTL